MKTMVARLGSLVLTGSLIGTAGTALAQQAPTQPPPQAQQEPAQPAQGPTSPPPSAPPSAAPGTPPSAPPPSAQAQPPQPAAPPQSQWVYSYPTGQWVYTADNGWVWVPAGATTTAVEGVPYTYLYTPAYGWTWYVSPWGWGGYHYGSWVAHTWRPYGWRGGWVAHPRVVGRIGGWHGPARRVAPHNYHRR